MLGNIPDGKYPIKISTNNFDYQSSATVNIQSLKFHSLNIQEGQPFEKITIKANFLPNKTIRYFADFRGRRSQIEITNTGEGFFIVPDLSEGVYPLQIGYTQNEFNTTTVPTNINFTVKAKETNLDFYPKKAKANEKIKLLITNISSNALFVGGQSVMISYENDGTYFYVPESLPKGKHKLSILSALEGLKYYEASDYLEIY